MDISEQVVVNIFNLPRFDIPLKRSKKMTKKKKSNSNSNPSQILYNNFKPPKKTFGVFVTIHRENDKISEYPIDIHGCIGNWNKDYKKMSQYDIYDNIMNVSSQAFSKDERHSYFPPLNNDVFSTIEINYLLLPIYEISTKKTKQGRSIGYIDKLMREFDNNEFGLIVDGPHVATYLPNVFPKINWTDIKRSLLHKAGQYINSNISEIEKAYKFYAYKTVSKSIRVFDLIYKKMDPKYSYSDSYPRRISYYFIEFVNQNLLNNKLPFLVNKENMVLVDDAEIIRNLSVLHTFVKLSNNHFMSDLLKSQILSILASIYSIVNKLDEQSLANLISLIYLVNTNDNMSPRNNNKPTFIFPINDKLIEKLYKKIPKSDKVFERPQIILSIFDVLQYNIKENEKQMVDFIIYILELYDLDTTSSNTRIDDVFRLNWDSQVFSKIYEIITNSNLKSINDVSRIGIKDNILAKFKTQFESYKNIYQNMSLDEMLHLETNYLAVSFEGLMSLLKCIDPEQFPIQSSITFRLFQILISRINLENGLIYFKSGDARLDITCHFLNGF